MEEDEIWWSPEKKRKRLKEMTARKITAGIRKVERQVLLEVEKDVAVRPIWVAPLDNAVSKNALGQAEFYFSDGNLLSDKFLADSINGSDDGLAGMRYHLGLGSVKAEEVQENTVLAVSQVLKNSPLLTISDDGKKVGQMTPLIKREQVIAARRLDAEPIRQTAGTQSNIAAVRERSSPAPFVTRTDKEPVEQLWQGMGLSKHDDIVFEDEEIAAILLFDEKYDPSF